MGDRSKGAGGGTSGRESGRTGFSRICRGNGRDTDAGCSRAERVGLRIPSAFFLGFLSSSMDVCASIKKEAHEKGSSESMRQAPRLRAPQSNH